MCQFNVTNPEVAGARFRLEEFTAHPVDRILERTRHLVVHSDDEFETLDDKSVHSTFISRETHSFLLWCAHTQQLFAWFWFESSCELIQHTLDLQRDAL